MRLFTLSLVGLAVGCSPNLQKVDAELSRGVSRAAVNKAARDCMMPLAGSPCARLGFLSMHGDEDSMRRNWSEPIDRDVAREAFTRGCMHGDGPSCRGLVEFELAETDEQWAWAKRRAAFLRTPVRTREEVTALQNGAHASAAAEDLAYDQRTAEKQAEVDAKYSAAWVSAGEAVSNSLSQTQVPGAVKAGAPSFAEGSHGPPSTAHAPAGHPFVPPGHGHHAPPADGVARQLARDEAFQQSEANQTILQTTELTEEQARTTKLSQCLATPITRLRTTQSNPFLAHAQTFEAILQKLKGACAEAKTWSAWNECMGSLSMNALWVVEDRAVADSADMFRRFRTAGPSYKGPSACLEGQDIQGTRADCLLNTGSLEVVRNLCATRLQSDADKMRCDFTMLPNVWDAENVQADGEARAKIDTDCHQRFGP